MAYDVLADAYDEFTTGDDYDSWADLLVSLIGDRHVTGQALLDVGCGTGKSAVAFAHRGFDVVGFDVSAGMVDVARSKVPHDLGIQYVVHDVRLLPAEWTGSFDVAVCMDDGLNYLGEDAELRSAFREVGRTLKPGGAFLFDLNTLATYRTAFARPTVLDGKDRCIVWTGHGSEAFEPGHVATATIDVFTREVGNDSAWSRKTSHHRQRHFANATVSALLAETGFVSVRSFGLHSSGVLDEVLDEAYHTKAIYSASKEWGWRT